MVTLLPSEIAALRRVGDDALDYLLEGSNVISYRQVAQAHDVRCETCDLFRNSVCSWDIAALLRFSRETLSARYAMEIVENECYDGQGCSKWIPNKVCWTDLAVRARLMGKSLDQTDLAYQP